MIQNRSEKFQEWNGRTAKRVQSESIFNVAMIIHQPDSVFSKATGGSVITQQEKRSGVTHKEEQTGDGIG